jgi:hypothetical protein
MVDSLQMGDGSRIRRRKQADLKSSWCHFPICERSDWSPGRAAALSAGDVMVESSFIWRLATRLWQLK